ncbi:MmpS family transport accessory protein [Micromonospora sp. WMMC273]|uniref:MmpS family transport accessory protein n=1 Tax=Micromonospora sp. WMMC273 TaxID=3015157 RepID=UPI0022B5F4F0|nr:MmpS family transport accessory protein [Micromonospora sp. WMMC273]MCZ7478892.1 MmpS family transport accessory protein [Micromonospora sp. WMMC273]
MRRTTIAGFAVIALLALGCGAGGTDDVEGPGAQQQPADAPASSGAAKAKPADDGKKSIVMEVSGPSKADITFGISGDQSQEQGAELPWKKTLTSGEAFLIPTIVAQSKGSGTITCKITIDGKLVKTNSSKGQFAVVTCTADTI